MNSVLGTKGQIVEILADAEIYNKEKPAFPNKKSELIWQSTFPEYDLFDGILVGGHSGIENFKIGQRKGLNLGNRKGPYYIISIDKNENRIFVGVGNNHPGLYRKVISIPLNQIDFTQELNFDSENSIEVLIKNESDFEEEATLYPINGNIYIEFKNKAKVYQINQHLLIYTNKNLLGTTNNLFKL